MKKEKYWSRFAEDYNTKQEYVTSIELKNEILQQIAKLNNLGHILEFACGNGAYTETILKSGSKITATDYSEEMVEYSKKIFSDNNQIIVEQANCYKTPYPTHFFDTVFMAHLIHTIDNPAAALKESHRLLKSNGSLIITSFTTDRMKIRDKVSLLHRYKKTFGRLPELRTNFTLKSLCELVTEQNFTIQEALLLGTQTKAIFLKAIKN